MLTHDNLLSYHIDVNNEARIEECADRKQEWRKVNPPLAAIRVVSSEGKYVRI